MPSTHQTWISFCICHELSLLDFDHIDQCERTSLEQAEQVAWHIFNFITLRFFSISSAFLSTCELKTKSSYQTDQMKNMGTVSYS